MISADFPVKNKIDVVLEDNDLLDKYLFSDLKSFVWCGHSITSDGSRFLSKWNPSPQGYICALMVTILHNGKMCVFINQCTLFLIVGLLPFHFFNSFWFNFLLGLILIPFTFLGGWRQRQCPTICPCMFHFKQYCSNMITCRTQPKISGKSLQSKSHNTDYN